MAGRSPVLDESKLEGFKYFELIQDLLLPLQSVGTARDKAGNREFFCNNYVALLLFYFFNPTITSLKGLQAASGLEKVQKALGIKRVSLGSFSESAHYFDPEPLQHIIQELAGRALQLPDQQHSEALRGLTAVDGSVLKALPRMAWALWQDETHRGAKLHLHFDVLTATPRNATVTAAACSEPEQLRRTLEAGRLYVTDRGYEKFALFRSILDAKSSFIARVKDNLAYEVKHENAITEDARAAGVIRDAVLARIGTSHHMDEIRQELRLVVVQATGEDGKPYELWLLTDRLQMPAELVALAYRYRWTIELFFRWLKSILGIRHLLSDSQKGVTMQLYAALIASLLIVLWTGLKVSKRTWEMVQHYLLGWASVAELQRHLLKEKEQQARAAAKKQSASR
jgi:hypothetical protein